MPLFTTLLVGGLVVSILSRAQWPKSGQKKIQPTTNTALQQVTPKIETIEPNQTLSAVEAEVAHQQYVSIGAFCLLGIGAISSPVMTLAGLSLLSYNYFYLMKKIKESYLTKSKLIIALLDVLSVSFALFMGFFFTASLLFTAVFTTRRLIAKTECEAHIDFNRIFGELSDTVWLLKDGVEVEIPLNSLQTQDIIVVHAGEMIPVDGHIVAGEGMVDQHLLTGEAQPIEKKTGDEVLTSTLLISGFVHILVEKQGHETITGQIAKTLEHATTFKHQAQSRGEQIVEKGALRTIVACITALPFVGFNHAVALSYSGFGYQMRMAAPLMVLNYFRISSRNGILIKDGRALDKLHNVDTIVFDKTGTLTEEVPQVGCIIVCEGFSEPQLLQYAASAEQRQKHPIAQAICQYANHQGLPLLALATSDYVIGHGLRAELIEHSPAPSHQTILIGSRRFVDTVGIEVPENIEILQTAAGERGYSIVYVALDNGVLMGAIELRPSLRPQALDAVVALHQLNMTLYIISGDQEQPTQYLAGILNIDHYFSNTLPKDKANIIAQLQADGRKVCFIGDGINDSVALQQADVSVSLHGAATIAQDSAEIVLMTPDLLHLPYLINMSKELHRRMNQSEFLNMASGVTCVSGILFFGMGLSGAILLYSSGLLVNISNAMLPLLMHPQTSK